MPNPSRPQYKEIIESTWGLAVADHVTRRYATPAERDADLAGFTAAQLAGQVVTITPSGGPAYTQVYSEGRWYSHPIQQAGFATIVTDAAGNGGLGFPHPFARAPLVLVSVVSSDTKSGLVKPWGVTAAGFSFAFYQPNGSAAASWTANFTWLAFDLAGVAQLDVPSAKPGPDVDLEGEPKGPRP